MKYLIVLVVLPLIAAAQNHLSNCENSCLGLDNGTWIEDVHDCNSYFVCPDVGRSHFCGENKVPNAILRECVDTTQDCDPLCGGQCKLECNVSVDVVLDFSNNIDDCRSYYLCAYEEEPSLKTCPESSPYFNVQSVSCSNDPNVCCYPCSPQCGTNEIGNTEDPRDCTKYYICQNGTNVGRASCREGHVFNSTSKECQAGSSCTSLCGGALPVTTVPPIPPTDPQGCLLQKTCTEAGYYAKCPHCESTYFECADGNGGLATVETCADGRVFNPGDNYPYCIFPEECPYTS